MTRNKWAVLGLSALALLAMSAFVVNGAQAESENPEFTCLENHTTHVACTVTTEVKETHREIGEEFPVDHRFETALTTLTCNTVIGHSEDANGTDPTPTVTAAYEECQDTVSGNFTHVSMNSCGFELHPEKTSGKTIAEDEYEGTMSIHCTKEGDSITMAMTNASEETKCLIHIHPQNGIGPVYFRTMTEADPTDVTVEAVKAPVPSTFTGGFLNCGVFGEEGTARYSGSTTVIAKNSKGEPIDLELD